MSQTVVQQIPLDKLTDGENIRKCYEQEGIKGLSQSIRVSGLQAPVHVVPLDDDRYRVIVGSRRLRAARQAEMVSIAAIVHQALNRSEILVLQITENVQREGLKPTEKAKAIDTLMKETGWTASHAASKLGLTNGTLSKLLSLLSLPEDLQQSVDAGDLPATAAYQLSKLDDAQKRDQLAAQIARGELTRDGLSSAIKAKSQQRSAPRKQRPIRVTAKLENRETVCVAAPSLNLTSFVLILQKLLGHAERAVIDGLTLEQLRKRLASTRSSAPDKFKTS